MTLSKFSMTKFSLTTFNSVGQDTFTDFDQEIVDEFVIVSTHINGYFIKGIETSLFREKNSFSRTLKMFTKKLFVFNFKERAENQELSRGLCFLMEYMCL